MPKDNPLFSHLTFNTVVDIINKNVTINVDPAETNTAINFVALKKALRTSLEDVGLECLDRQGLPVTQDKNSFRSVARKILKSHWFLACLGIGLGLAVLILSMFLSASLSFPMLIVIALLSTAFTLLLGADFYWQAIKGLLNAGELSMDALFTISTITSLITSIAALHFSALPMMFETSLLIFGFRHLGLAIEEFMTQKIVTEKKLADRLSDKVKVIDSCGQINKCLRSSVKVGDLLLLDGKDMVPIDGEALNDTIIYDTIKTGAILPREVKRGESLVAGMHLAEDAPSLKIKVTPIIQSLKSGEIIPVDGICYQQVCTVYDEISNQSQQVPINAVLHKGMRLLTDAKLQVTDVANYTYLHRLDNNNCQFQQKKAPIQEATSKILNYFTPGIFLLALLTGIVIGILFSPALAIQSTISILVAACPCTLGLITPLCMKIGLQKAVKNKVRFKNSKALQAANDINAVIFDLNGTITIGKPTFTKIINLGYITNKMILDYFAALEKNSSHPIVKAILNSIPQKQMQKNHITAYDINSQKYFGRKGKITRHNKKSMIEEIIIGNEIFIKDEKIDLSGIQKKLHLKHGQSAIYIVRNKILLGCIIVTDLLRPGAEDTINLLQQMDMPAIICTGADNQTAIGYAKDLKLFNNKNKNNNNLIKQYIYAGCIPTAENTQEQANPRFIQTSKITCIEELQSFGYNVAMVGDASNDAAAVAKVFGIAMKSQAADEITQHQAAVIVEGESLLAVANAFTIAHQTMSNIKQNLIFSLIYNIAAVTVSVGLMLAGLSFNPAIGVLLMSLQTGLILLNVYRYKLQKISPNQTISNAGKSNQQKNAMIVRSSAMNKHQQQHTVNNKTLTVSAGKIKKNNLIKTGNYFNLTLPGFFNVTHRNHFQKIKNRINTDNHTV